MNSKPIREMLVKTFPFILTAILTNSFVIIDTAMTNTLGNASISALATVTVLYWVCLIPCATVSNPYRILLSLHKENKEYVKFLNLTSIVIYLIGSIILSIGLIIFADKIISIFVLEQETHNMAVQLTGLLGILLPIKYMKDMLTIYLAINRKQKLISISMAISAILNIGGDVISLKFGYGIIGIYIATILSNLLNVIILFKASKIRFNKFDKRLAKEIWFIGKDFALERITQRIVNLWMTRLVSMQGAEKYAIYSIIFGILNVEEDIVLALREADVTWLGEWANGKYNVVNILKHLDRYSIVTFLIGTISVSTIAYPVWLMFKGDTVWQQCLIGSYINALIIGIYTIRYSFDSFLKISKDTKNFLIATMLGSVVRVIVSLIVCTYCKDIQLIMLAFLLDGLVRTLYCRFKCNNIVITYSNA